MAKSDKRAVTMEELLVSSLAQTDALAKLEYKSYSRDTGPIRSKRPSVEPEKWIY